MSNAPDSEQIASMLRARQRRSELFGKDIFGDPAWEMMLELFAAQREERRVSLSDLTDIAPASTLVRWAAALEQLGLVLGKIDPSEPSESWLQLAPGSASKMEKVLAELSPLSPHGSAQRGVG